MHAGKRHWCVTTPTARAALPVRTHHRCTVFLSRGRQACETLAQILGARHPPTAHVMAGAAQCAKAASTQ